MATAQKQATAAINSTQSLVLVKNMLRVSISQICFQRNIFNPDLFSSKEYAGATVHQLESAETDADGKIVVKNRDAFLLTQWLEKGVFHAIEKQYLESLTFAVFTKDAESGKDHLVETYSFNVNYPESEKKPYKVNGVDITKENVKQQAIALIRSLIEFTSTLGPLPEERWLTLRVQYYDEKTPANYEPEFFRAADMDSLCFERNGSSKICKIKIGKLETPNHCMTVKYAGLDLFEDQQQSLSMMPPPALLVVAKHYTAEERKDGDNEDKLTESLAALSTVPEHSEADDVSVATQHDHSSTKNKATIEQVRSYVMTAKKVSVTDCARELHIKPTVVKETFTQMEHEGVIVRKGKGYTYSAPQHDLESQSQVIDMASPSRAPFKTTTQQAPHIPPQPASASKSLHHHMAPSMEIALSQESAASVSRSNKKRKISVIEKPIQQQLRLRRKL